MFAEEKVAVFYYCKMIYKTILVALKVSRVYEVCVMEATRERFDALEIRLQNEYTDKKRITTQSELFELGLLFFSF